MTSIQELIESIQHADVESGAKASALAHLCSSPHASEVDESRIATAELLRTYRLRLAHEPGDVVGTGDLVEMLESTPDAAVLLAVHVSDGRVTAIARTLDGRLLGCVAGPDRRVPGTT